MDESKHKHQVWELELLAVVVDELHHGHGINKELIQIHVHHRCSQEHCNEDIHCEVAS